MLKKTITYEDYDGNEITEDFYFHLSKAELAELELSEQGGLGAVLQNIIDERDGKRIIEMFKKIIQMSYGKRSEDGKRFIKNEDILNEFTQTPAYSELFIELATDAEAGAAFMNGVVPASLAKEVAKVRRDQDKPTGPAPMPRITQAPDPAKDAPRVEDAPDPEKDVDAMTVEEMRAALRRNK